MKNSTISRVGGGGGGVTVVGGGVGVTVVGGGVGDSPPVVLVRMIWTCGEAAAIQSRSRSFLVSTGAAEDRKAAIGCCCAPEGSAIAEDDGKEAGGCCVPESTKAEDNWMATAKSKDD